MSGLNLLDESDRKIARSLAKDGQGCTTSSGERISPEDLKELVSWWDEFLQHPDRIVRVVEGRVTDVEKR